MHPDDIFTLEMTILDLKSIEKNKVFKELVGRLVESCPISILDQN